MRRTTIACTVLIVLLCTRTAHAWGGGGHTTVARLVWNALDANQREAAYELLKQHPHVAEYFAKQPRPEGISEPEWYFMVGSTWADWVRGFSNRQDPESQRIGALSQALWHYIDLPYIKPGDEALFKDRKLDPPESNAVYALKLNHDVLIDRTRSAADRAVALTWMLHVVADLHQPLHCVGLFAQGLPDDGDQGGNLFWIKSGPSATKLHGYWDGLPTTGDNTIETNVRLLSGPEYGRDHFAEQLKHTQYAAWAEEGNQLARKYVYLEGKLPGKLGNNATPEERAAIPALPDNYYEQSLAVARRQLALAGYRLLDEMNIAFPRSAK